MSNSVGRALQPWHLALLATLSFASFSVIPPVLDVLVRERFVDPGATSRFMSVHGLAALIFGLVGGIASDRWRSRRLLLGGGLLGSGVCTALLPQIDTFGLLLVVRLVDGACGAIALVQIFKLGLAASSEDQRVKNMAVISTSIALGFLLASVLVMMLLPFGLEVLFATIGGCVAASGLWALRASEPAALVALPLSPPRKRLRTVLLQPRLLLVLLFTFIDRYTFGTIAHLTSLILVDRWSKSAEHSSLSLFLFWMAYLAMCMPSGRRCLKRGGLQTMLLGSALYGMSLMLMGIADYWIFMVAMTLAGGLCAMQYIPSIALIGSCVDDHQRGSVMGTWNLVGSIGMIAGLLGSGIASRSGYEVAYGLAGGMEIVLAVAVALALWLRERARLWHPRRARVSISPVK